MYLVLNLPKSSVNAVPDRPPDPTELPEPDKTATEPGFTSTLAISDSTGKSAYKRCCSVPNLSGLVFNIFPT